MISPANRLVYRLPQEVRCQERPDSLLLVRRFPLKLIRLHPIWKATFSLLSLHNFVTVDEIADVAENVDSDSMEIFLNDLVRKGFLEQEGISEIRDYPFVSVIIPVRNRPEEIKACLQSLIKLVYPLEKFEIIVVDDASDDHTPDVIKGFDVRLISLKENRMAPFCRNLAARKAKGDILAFIDSDCTSDPLWLSELLAAFKDPAIGAVGGVVDSFFCANALDKYEQVNSSLIMGTHAKRSRENEKFFYVPSCNLLVKRDLFLNIGGFKEELFVGEDVDLCWRLQDAGYPVEFRPNGKIFHKHRNTIGAFCQRRFDYGTSEPLLQVLHKNRGKQMLLPLWGTLFWSVVILSITFSLLPLLYICPFVMLMDYMEKNTKVKQSRITVTASQLFSAIVRGYAALFYHCSAFASRYYLLWFVPVIWMLPGVSGIFLLVHFISGLIDYFLKKPSLNLFSFLFYYSIEQLSYQAGVWYGCIKHKSFSAVNPIIIFQKQTE